MRRGWLRAVALAAVLYGIDGGAGTEAQAQYSRRTPIVEAVAKTRASIVSIKVEKKNGWSRSEVGGTGVIVDERGYIVTNRHVIVSASRIVVRLAEGSELVAESALEDPSHDLAVLRVTPRTKLQALRFGPSSDLMVGETVIAVGHPFGYTNTVSTGIVSALDREVTMPTGEVLRGLIQTDASINPGNSGGPLLNINGELVGINVALREKAQGIAFALSSESVQRVIARELSAANVAGVSHGLTCGEQTSETAGPDRQKVVVEFVTGAAAEAGLQKGDAVVQVGEREVFNRLDLERAVWGCKVGEEIPVTIVRDGKELALALTLNQALVRNRTTNQTAASLPPRRTPSYPTRVDGVQIRKR